MDFSSFACDVLDFQAGPSAPTGCTDALLSMGAMVRIPGCATPGLPATGCDLVVTVGEPQWTGTTAEEHDSWSSGGRVANIAGSAPGPVAGSRQVLTRSRQVCRLKMIFSNSLPPCLRLLRDPCDRDGFVRSPRSSGDR